MYKDNIKLFAKNEKELNTGSENIQSVYRDEMLHRKICHANNEKCKKKQMTEGIELYNKKKSECCEKRKLTST